MTCILPTVELSRVGVGGVYNVHEFATSSRRLLSADGCVHGDIISPAHCHLGNVMVGNIACNDFCCFRCVAVNVTV